MRASRGGLCLTFFVVLAQIVSVNVYAGADPEDPSRLAFRKTQSGDDIRLPVQSKDYPFSAIGKVEGESGNCSGAMVSRYHVALNRHCICVDAKCTKRKGFTFHANYNQGTALLSSKDYWAWWGNEDIGIKDWALVRLKSPIGDRVGWLGVDGVDFDTVNSAAWTDRLFLVGYPADFAGGQKPILYLRCSITHDEGRSGWRHDCDTKKGASGSPLAYLLNGKPYIAALHWGRNPDAKDEAIAVPAKSFLKRLKQLKEEDPNKYPKTTIFICHANADAGEISASIGYRSDSGFTSEGHWRIKRGQCKEIPIAPAEYSDKLYVFGNRGRTEWKGKYQLAWSSDVFTIENAAATGHAQYKGFNQVEVKYDRVNTFRFE